MTSRESRFLSGWYSSPIERRIMTRASKTQLTIYTFGTLP